MRCITRQRCRVRIETRHLVCIASVFAASPGSDAGCGLKPKRLDNHFVLAQHHPAAMPGAD